MCSLKCTISSVLYDEVLYSSISVFMGPSVVAGTFYICCWCGKITKLVKRKNVHVVPLYSHKRG